VHTIRCLNSLSSGEFIFFRPSGSQLVIYMRAIHFIKGNYYHIYNRGVDKRLIFHNGYDRRRFLNTSEKILQSQDEQKENYPRIHTFCLMSNHYHFILEEKRKGGISKFMARLGNSYTKYFNTRYDRSGRLFSSSFKAKHVYNDRYLTYLSAYIHLNPLGILTNDLSVTDKHIKKLAKYRWSSLSNYLDGDGFSFVETQKILSYFSTPADYLLYLKHAAMMPNFKDVSPTFEKNKAGQP